MYEYTLIYKNQDSNALFEAWPSYRLQLRKILETQYPVNIFLTMWSDDIEDFFILLKLLPFKSIGRNNKATSETFIKSIEKLIIFSEVIS